MISLDQPRKYLAIGLAALAGFVDAAGFLSAGGYFASFMSGNTTRLGIDLSNDFDAALMPAGLVSGFVLGVVLGALFSEWGGRWRKTAVLSLAFCLLFVAAVLDQFWQTGFIGAAVIAMGAINNVFRRDGEVKVGVTYMTGALVRFGQGLAARLLGNSEEGRFSAIGLWVGLAAGAVSGALSFSYYRASTPWIAVAICSGLLLSALLIERRSVRSGG